ncbi:hypothetical protein AURDEDRAFT_162603 [Auricularia subglabra TFB-10046 SS5]|nr:hypothetical protein AURDEDRAFT_162603 [Auricularia subglabra TFB-10046 SS5]
MDPITLYLCSRSQTIASLQQLRSRAVNSNDVRTIIVSEARAHPESERIDEALLADILAECRNVNRLDLDRWTFNRVSDASIRRAAVGSLGRIKELIVGARGSLMTPTLFSLLAAMPSLQSLELNSILDPPEPTPGPVPTPSCSLASLAVIDDWGIDFKHYAHLLCNSHDTLEHLELHWVLSPEIEPFVLEGLKSCRVLRDLVLLGNQFNYAKILSLCPQIRCLTLIDPPSDDEMAALCAPLRELRLIHCTPETDAGIIADHLPQLRDLLPRLPALGTIRVVSGSVQRDDAYRELRLLCARQRLHFTTYLEGYDWVM